MKKLKWQDILIMIGGFCFSIALIPTVLAVEKPTLFTSLLTGIILYSFCVAYISLRLKLAFIATMITASMWLVLAIQVLMR